MAAFGQFELAAVTSISPVSGPAPPGFYPVIASPAYPTLSCPSPRLSHHPHVVLALVLVKVWVNRRATDDEFRSSVRMREQHCCPVP